MSGLVGAGYTASRGINRRTRHRAPCPACNGKDRIFGHRTTARKNKKKQKTSEREEKNKNERVCKDSGSTNTSVEESEGFTRWSRYTLDRLSPWSCFGGICCEFMSYRTSHVYVLAMSYYRFLFDLLPHPMVFLVGDTLRLSSYYAKRFMIANESPVIQRIIYIYYVKVSYTL